MSRVHRIHKSEAFAQIPNAVLRDSRLSYRARGILAMVLSHADYWEVDKDFIESGGTEGDLAITTAFRELEALGYRRVERVHDEQGRISSQVHWYETPPEQAPEPASPAPDSPAPGNSGPGYSGGNRTPTQNTITEHHSPPPVVTSPDVPRDHDGFEDFWQAYPRKERRVVAEAAYQHALRSTTPEALLHGAQGYARRISRDDTEPRFIQTPDRWLREERWTDDYRAPRHQIPWWGTADD